MIQCFAPQSFESSFVSLKPPRLLSASKIDSYYSRHPRVLHQHSDTFEILFVRSGTGVYIVDEKRYSIRKGDLILCNAGTLHDEDPTFSDNLYTLSVASTNIYLENLPPNHLIERNCPPVLPVGDCFDIVENTMLSIYGFLSREPDCTAEICHHLNIALLSIILFIVQRQIMRDGQKVNSQDNLIASQVKDYINTHYHWDFTLQDIAEEIHVNPYHLSHVFKEVTGYSPKQYNLRRRLGEAQTLLITTRISITEIAT